MASKKKQKNVGFANDEKTKFSKNANKLFVAISPVMTLVVSA